MRQDHLTRCGSKPDIRDDHVQGQLSAHYAIGVIFAALLLAIWGIEWVRDQTLARALRVGILDIEESQNWHGAAIEN